MEVLEVTTESESKSEPASCSICMDALNEPVTRSCGHVHCGTCIRKWYATEQIEDGKEGSCPDCRDGWVPRNDIPEGELGELLRSVGQDIMSELMLLTLMLERGVENNYYQSDRYIQRMIREQEQAFEQAQRAQRSSLTQRLRNGWNWLWRRREYRA